MESQIKQLKLNATNIKGTLIRGNKELKKLRIKERNLFNRQRISAKRLQKESFVEGRIPGSGMVAGAARRMAAPAMSLLDRIKEFAGVLLLGIVVNNLPSLIKRAKKFLDDNQWLIETVKSVFNWLGGLFQVLVDVYNFFRPEKKAQLEKERKELNDALNKLVGATNDIGSEAKEADAAVDKFVGDQLRERTPEQVRSDVVTAFKEQKLTEQNFTTTRLAITKTYFPDTPVKLTAPGIGTFERVKDNSFMGIFRPYGMKETATDIFGNQISKEEFQKRANVGYRVAEGFDTDIVKDLKAAGIPGFSQGGTVRPASSSSGRSNQAFPGESATARKARESTQSFRTFERNETERNFLLDTQSENNDKLSELIDNFKELYSVGITTALPSSPYTTNRPNAPGPVISTPPGLPGIKVEPTEVIGTVGYTGFTQPTGPGGSHIHIENMSNYGDGIPQAVKYSILVNGNPMPQALQFTSGIGWRWGKMHRGEDFAGNPNQPITLTGGLKFKQFIPDQGDGYGNRVLIEAPDGTIYSLNHLNAGPTNINALVKKQQNLGQGNSTSGPGSPGYGGQGGRATDLTQTFDDGGSEVVMIMAQQPVIVPGPTRYITRTRTQTMPVPVQIAPKSSGLRSLV